MKKSFFTFLIMAFLSKFTISQRTELAINYAYLYNPNYRYFQDVFTFSRPWLSEQMNFLQHGISGDIRYSFDEESKIPFSVALHSDYFHLKSSGYDLPSLDLVVLAPECDWTFKLKGSFTFRTGIGILGSAMKRDFPNEQSVLDNERRFAYGLGVSIKTGIVRTFLKDHLVAGVYLRTIPMWYAPDAEVLFNDTKGLLSGPISYAFTPSVGMAYSIYHSKPKN
jgi:hypothetical protein